MVSSTVLPSSRSERIVSHAAPARRRIEAGRRLVEEDELRVADEREREVEPPLLAARQRPRALVGRLRQAGQRDRLVDVARRRIQAGPVRDGLAHGQVPVHAAGLEHDAEPLAQGDRPRSGVEAEHGHAAARARAVALEDLDRRRLAGAVGPEQAEDLAAPDGEGDAAHGGLLAVGLAQVLDLDRHVAGHPSPIMATLCRPSCAAPASTSGPTRPACSSPTSPATGWRRCSSSARSRASGGGSPRTARSRRTTIEHVAAVVAAQIARRARPARSGCASWPRRRSAPPPTRPRCWRRCARAPASTPSS